MTRRVTISLPDDVAEVLDTLKPRQVSAYVTEAIRRRYVSESTRALLKRSGFTDLPAYDPETAVAKAEAASAAITPEVRDAAYRRYAEASGESLDEVRAMFERGRG